jgi:hypothetical protein
LTVSTSAVRHSLPGASHLLRHHARMLSRTGPASMRNGSTPVGLIGALISS